MKVILLTKVANLGSVGDVISVKDGYARNFLIPQKKAIFYSAANYKVFELQKQNLEKQNQEQISQAESNRSKVAGKDVIIIGSASDDGRLYGSVNSGVIANKVNELLGKKIVSRLNIVIGKPIKEIGVYDILVNFYSDVSANVRLIVSRSESEIKALLAAHKENSEKAAKKEEPVQKVVQAEESLEVVQEEA